MIRTIVIHATLTIEGEREPELVVTQRLKWDDSQSLDEFAESALRHQCLMLRARNKAQRIA